VREIAEHLVARARRPLHVTVNPELVRPVEVPRLVGDGSRLRAATGWSPVFGLDDTLTSVLEHARVASVPRPPG
jgi:GDP-4-dehydro-6-deoxy-D-mannose reductase